MIQLLTVLLPTAYLAVLLAYAHDFRAQSEDRHTRLRRIYFYATLTLHAGLFAAYVHSVDGAPQFDRFHVVSALGLVTGLLYAVVGEGADSTRQGRAGVGLFVVALVFGLQLIASALGPLTVEPYRADSTFYILHVGTILLASASLALSGTYGGLYLLLYRQMRGKRFGPLYRSLPSLSELASQTRRASAFACGLLFLGVNGGIAWAHARNVPEFSYSHPLVLIALGLCAHFALVAFSRHLPGMNPRRASYAATLGLVVFLASLYHALAPGKFN